MDKHHRGSCLCAKITFEIIGDFDNFFLCHCKHCQKDTGSAHAANLFSQSAQINWLSGNELREVFTLPSTQHTRSFCSQCGSAVPTLVADNKVLMVPAGSLDTALNITPNAHLFGASRASWDYHLEMLTCFEHLPE